MTTTPSDVHRHGSSITTIAAVTDRPSPPRRKEPALASAARLYIRPILPDRVPAAAISRYRQCPRALYYQYIARAAPQEPPSDSASALSNAVHAALSIGALDEIISLYQVRAVLGTADQADKAERDQVAAIVQVLRPISVRWSDTELQCLFKLIADRAEQAAWSIVSQIRAVTGAPLTYVDAGPADANRYDSASALEVILTSISDRPTHTRGWSEDWVFDDRLTPDWGT